MLLLCSSQDELALFTLYISTTKLLVQSVNTFVLKNEYSQFKNNVLENIQNLKYFNLVQIWTVKLIIGKYLNCFTK